MSEPITTAQPDVLQPVPVLITETENKAPEFGVWQTLYLPFPQLPIQILPKAEKRNQAIVLLAPGSAGNVFIGTIGQVSNGQGGLLYPGIPFVVKASTALYAVAATASVWLTIVDERYQ